MDYAQKTKLVLSDLGSPKAVTAEDFQGKEMLLGTIIGLASAIKVAKGTDGITEFHGMKGTFEGTPADPKRNVILSSVCYMPDDFQDPVLNLLRGREAVGKEGDDDYRPPVAPVEEVKIAFEVYAIKADNPQGYSWMLKPLMDYKANDPLAALRAEIAEVKQIDAKKK